MSRFYVMMVCCVLLSSNSSAQDVAVERFKAIVSKTDAAFKKLPVLYDVQDFQKSPSGRIVIPKRYIVGPSRIDVRRTTSLIKTLVGDMQFEAYSQTAGLCGSVPRPMGGSDASSVEEAKDIAGKEECWRSEFKEPCEVTMQYGYSDSKWALDSISSRPAGCALMFNYSLGAVTPGRVQTDINDVWKAILLP